MPNSQAPEESGIHLEEATLEELMSLLEDDFQDLIETFLDDGRFRLEELGAAVNTNAVDDVRQSAHSFKGTSLNVGAGHLSGMCSELELCARSGSLAGAGMLLERIEHEFNQVDALLRERYL